MALLFGRRMGGAILWILLAAGPGWSHNTSHNYTFQDNGTVKIGRDAEAGGCIVWVSESAGTNVVNNGDLGRQIQMNTRDAVGDYNPTQAGDGPNPSGSLVYYTHANYTFSKCVPLLFYNLPPYSGPPRPANGHLFYMWSEFLPNSSNRGFRVRGYWENSDPLQGVSSSHAVAPADILNYSDFTKVLTYNGKTPWTGGALSTVTDPTGDFVGTDYKMTELWHGLYNNSNWGLGHLENFGWSNLLFFLDASQSGDHQWACKSTAAWERCAFRIDPGETMQTREGAGIYYLGDVTAARNFFSNFQPVKTNNFSDDFADTHMRNWWRNSNPIQTIGGQVKMGPDTAWTNDLSLADKFWQDGTFSVDIKHESGSSWYGMAIHKVGQGHFWESNTGYYLIYLTSGGGLTLYSPATGTIASASVPGYVATNWNNLSVTVTGFSFTVKVNGNTYITASDAGQNYPAGFVSLVSDKNVTWFDNFSVTASGGDSTAPAQATGLSVSQNGQPTQLALSWTNPVDADWRWTRVVRKTGSSPTHWRDGYPVYEGKLSAYVDPDCQSGTTYFYAAYTVDHAGNYSAPVTGSGTPGAGGSPPVANFSGTPTSGAAPLTVNFTDSSTNSPTGWAWDFQNNGSTDSTAQNPSFQYTAAGTYTVKLTATNAAGSDDEIKTDYIVVTGGSQQQSWTASTGFSSTQGLNDWWYKEWNGSTYTNMTWDAGNSWWEGAVGFCLVGNNWQHPDTNDSARTWVSPQTGSAQITGNVAKGDINGGDGVVATILKNSTVVWGPQGIAFNDSTGFNFDVTTAVAAGDSIYFRLNKNVSTNNDSTNWNPTITLTWGGGSPPVANFSGTPTSGNAPLTVNFTDQSTGSPTSWAWDFDNNGTTDSTAQNPSYQYTVAGTYTVKLTATNAGGSDDEIKTAYITVNSAPQTVSFESIAADDGYVLESGENTNVGGSNNSSSSTTSALRVGDNSQDRQYKLIVSFDTSSLPDGATITGATLKIKRGSLTGTNPFTTHGTCFADIKTGTFGAQALENSDFQAAATSSQVATMSNPASNGALSTGALNGSGLSAISKTGVTQMRVYLSVDDNDDNGNDYTGLYSGNNGTASNRPVLEVTYQ